MSADDIALLERAAVAAAERWWGDVYGGYADDAAAIARSLEMAGRFPGNTTYALHGAVARLIKARSEDTRR